MSLCAIVTCPDCGDRLIHQTNRGAHESSSAYGQHIHDDHPVKFFWCDVDGAIYKRATKILRVIEHKPPAGQLSPGQQTVLPFLALGVRVLVAVGMLNKQSGVFAVYSDHPFAAARVRQISGSFDAALTGSQLVAFETGEELTEQPSHLRAA